MKSQRYREQFDFLRENNIATQGDAEALQARTEETLANAEIAEMCGCTKSAVGKSINAVKNIFWKLWK